MSYDAAIDQCTTDVWLWSIHFHLCYIELNDLEPIKYLSIIDTTGKTLLRKVFNYHEVQLDISLLKSGLYFIRIETPTKTFIKRLIKK